MIAENPSSRSSLLKRVEDLERRNKELEEKLRGSMYEMKDKLFRLCTGFESVAVALEELRISGCEDLLSSVRRSGIVIPAEVMDNAVNRLIVALPDIADLLRTACDAIKTKDEQLLNRQKKRTGAPPVVDAKHLFLIPFVYVYGGFMQWQASFLPGLHVNQSQFSVLLATTLPIVVERWVPRYYRARGIDWLKQHCGPRDVDPEGTDFVLFYDGCKIRTEKSAGLREQKMSFNGKEKTNLVHFLGLTNEKGWFVEVTDMMGGRFTESNMPWLLNFWDAIDEEARSRNISVKARFIVDRGFRNNITKIRDEQDKESWKWKNLHVQMDSPVHLGDNRSQVEADEAELNRRIQARRWVNEKAFAFFQHSRLFAGILEMNSLAQVNSFQKIAVAIANMRQGCPSE